MKRIIPVIHLVNFDQVITNIETCIKLGINNVFIINHLTEWDDLMITAGKVKMLYPNLWVGLNFLDIEPKAILTYNLPYDALWIDKTLSLDDITTKEFKGEIFSGLNFKYQKQFYGPFLDDAVQLVKQTSTTACTSGAGTGISASTKKIEELKALLGDFPLALASGVSSENIEMYLPFVDTFLVASSITDKHEFIQEDLLKELISKI